MVEERHTQHCENCDDYFDGLLTENERSQFEQHLEGCPACRRHFEELTDLAEKLADCLVDTLGDDSEIRIRGGMKAAIDHIPAEPEVMTLEELAHMLVLPLSEVIPLLDELPAFEIGGRIRFRRDKIIAWIDEREKRRQRELDAQSHRNHYRIIAFPGS